MLKVHGEVIILTSSGVFIVNGGLKRWFEATLKNE
jgi:hypothetical protein